ncbi:MAG: YdiU family protein [Pseudomonadota bacterium]
MAAGCEAKAARPRLETNAKRPHNGTMLTHTYTELPEHFYAPVTPHAAPEPRLLAFNTPLATELGLALPDAPDELAALFSGAQLPAGAKPIALAYAGHQFGQLSPQLGDGRAALLGEAVTAAGHRFDVQLKGSGPTPFSRGGDGKSSLGPVVREYVISEAMHRLGVPTTRALAAVRTGEDVLRDTILPGGVLTRVAASHIRIGTFEYFAIRGDKDAVRQLADYAITRHYPEAGAADKPYRALFAAVANAHAQLVAHWMALGFIHGVMNTDNMSIAGETIDYGPCAFLDEFAFNKVFSSIDRGGRYAYNQQPLIAQWNLARFAECLLGIDDDKAAYESILGTFDDLFEPAYRQKMAAKLGFGPSLGDDDSPLIRDFLTTLNERGDDYTLSFRELAERLVADAEPRLGSVEERWRVAVRAGDRTDNDIRAAMDAVNPIVIPRNHQVERAIQASIGGDDSVMHALIKALASPFELQLGLEEFAIAPKPAERVVRTFCGT